MSRIALALALAFVLMASLAVVVAAEESPGPGITMSVEASTCSGSVIADIVTPADLSVYVGENIVLDLRAICTPWSGDPVPDYGELDFGGWLPSGFTGTYPVQGEDGYYTGKCSRSYSTTGDRTIYIDALSMEWYQHVTLQLNIHVIEGPRPHQVIRVCDATGDDDYTGACWELAKKTIGSALAAAEDDDQIWVASGTYHEQITLKQDVMIYGGFNGGQLLPPWPLDAAPETGPIEDDISDRDWQTNICTIDGGNSGSVVTSPSTAVGACGIDGFTITNGSSTNGGGISIDSSSPTIADCTIFGNTATGSGGGIYCTNGSAAISNCVVSNNSGAGVSCAGSSAPTILNSVFARNTGDGAALCGGTFKNNTAAFNTGYGLVLSGSADRSNNCISGNEAGNYSGCSAATGDIDDDPLFKNRVSPAYPGIPDAYRISSNSPCIRAGTTSGFAALDKDGRCRPTDGVTGCDIGAFQFKRICVTWAGSGDHSGDDWSNAIAGLLPMWGSDITTALNTATHGDEIWVAVSAYPYNDSITLKPGVELCGGFAGTEDDKTQRPTGGSETILSASTGTVVTVPQGCGFDTVIDGFTITGGEGSHVASAYELSGGGIACAYSSPTIINNEITENELAASSTSGAGIYLLQSAAIVSWNTITGNNAIAGAMGTARKGGGIYVQGSGESSICVLAGNTLSGNYAFNGSGICAFGPCYVYNNVITDNSVLGGVNGSGVGFGGGIYVANGTACRIYNNTIIGNTASNGSGFAWGGYGDPPALTNNIVAVNAGTGIYRSGAVDLPISYSCVFGNTPTNCSSGITLSDPVGTGSESLESVFVDSNGSDYRLASTSPCIDAGDPDDSAGAHTPAFDRDSNPRGLSRVDVGAYEFNGPCGGTVVVTSPSSEVSDLAPIVEWTCGASFDQYRVTVANTDPQQPDDVWDSDAVTGSETSAQITHLLTNGATYSVTVAVHIACGWIESDPVEFSVAFSEPPLPTNVTYCN